MNYTDFGLASVYDSTSERFYDDNRRFYLRDNVGAEQVLGLEDEEKSPFSMTSVFDERNGFVEVRYFVFYFYPKRRIC